MSDTLRANNIYTTAVLYSTLTGSTITTSAISYSTLTGSSITTTSLVLSTLSVSSINSGIPGVVAYSTLNVSTLNATSTIIASSIACSTLTTSTMTGNTLALSTLTVSSINSGPPGVVAYSTLNVSTLNATSTITTSTLITNSNMGIGVASPGASLQIYGDGTNSIFAQLNEIKITGNGNSHWSIFGARSGHTYFSIANTSNNAAIGTAGTDVLCITSSNNVGIGTVPSTTLHVYQLATNIIRMQTSSSDSAYIVSTYDYVFLSANYTSAGVRDNTGRGSAQIVLSQPTAGGIITFNTSPSVNTDVQERMRITAAGNIGIGTVPGYKLHVYGSMCLDRAAAAYTSTLANTTYAAGTWYTMFAPSSLTVAAGTYLISIVWATSNNQNPWYLASSFLFYNQLSNDNNASQLTGSTVPTSYHASNATGDWQLSVRAQSAGGSNCGLQWKSNSALSNGNWVVYAHLISV